MPYAKKILYQKDNNAITGMPLLLLVRALFFFNKFNKGYINAIILKTFQIN